MRGVRRIRLGDGAVCLAEVLFHNPAFQSLFNPDNVT